MTRDGNRALRELARDCGIQLSYVDVQGRRRRAARETVLSVLRSRGEVERPEDAPAALGRRRAARDNRLVRPFTVAWDGHARLELRMGRRDIAAAVELGIEGQGGAVADSRVALRPVRDDGSHVLAALDFVVDAEPGCYRLHLRAGRHRGESVLVVAPRRLYGVDFDEPAWGIATAVFALRDGPDLGVGHLGHLRSLGAWLGGFGARFVATLPLLPVFLDEPFDPSPYSPVSRRHWNEALLEPTTAVETRRNPTDALIDWHRVGQAVPQYFRARVGELPDRERGALDAFLESKPDVVGYARFRAAMARDGSPRAAEAGAVVDPDTERAFAYAQWEARRQLADLDSDLAARDVALLLDLPVGTHAAGYDVWEAPANYVRGVSVGAPPDDFNPHGQNWGFPPPDYEDCAGDGYAGLRACLDHHMEHAGALRIDHIMGLRRLYCVPDGASAVEGVYVASPAEELWALVSAASHRHRCRVVGEDLGTVPRATRAAIARHGALRTWVAQFEVGSDEPGVRPPRRCVASLSTHDTPTFAAWWTGADIDVRASLGHLDDAGARRLRVERAQLRAVVTETLAPPHGPVPRDDPAETDNVFDAIVGAIGGSPAAIVLLALEELWDELDPQNVPGTSDERPNWRRRHRLGLEEFTRDPEVIARLAHLDRARHPRQGGHT